MIDMAIPSDRNTSVKVVGKLSKYKDFEHGNREDTSCYWGARERTGKLTECQELNNNSNNNNNNNSDNDNDNDNNNKLITT